MMGCGMQTEVNYLGQLRHPNLVKLIGYCSEGDNRLLVYEFMPKGSLENHLFRSTPHCRFMRHAFFVAFMLYPDMFVQKTIAAFNMNWPLQEVLSLSLGLPGSRSQ